MLKSQLLVGLALAVVISPSCALVDALSGESDSGTGPIPTSDAAFPADNCPLAEDLGDISGGALTQFSLCGLGVNLDFADVCSADTPGADGVIVRMFSPTTAEYTICATGITPNSLLSIMDGPCLDQPFGFCVVNQTGCITTTLNAGESHLYWEPAVAGCENLDLEITPIPPE